MNLGDGLYKIICKIEISWIYTALYYQMTTLATVGYGDIIIINWIKKIYGIFILIVGTCAYSFILTYISNYIKKKQ